MKPQSRLPRSFWLLLLAGLALRCLALNQPLVDAHLIRQCQTAAATKSMIEQPGFPLSAKVAWLGDLDAHFALEFPLYNYLVIALHGITGLLDVSGKLCTILLWTASFACLQPIWRRFLDGSQTFWANLLFTISPLGVFYGQAFMPEMLVQFLAFAFVLLMIRYDENPTLSRWAACAAVGFVGLLVKLPEIAHLYVILGMLVFFRAGWKGLVQPRHLVAAVLTAAGLKCWGNYRDGIDAAYLANLSSSDSVRIFIGTFESRFHFKPWATIAAYLGFLVVPGPAVLSTAFGLWIFLRERCQKLLGFWLISLVVFYTLWFGNAATSQSYYNLPAMAPICALFGLGTAALVARCRVQRWRNLAVVTGILLAVLPAIPVWKYLFTQDRQILAAAQWVRGNTQPKDVIVFRPNHRWDMVDYELNPVMAYCADRPTFVWTRNTPERYRQVALEHARYALITLPPPPPGGLQGRIASFRGVSSLALEPTDWLSSNGFRLLTEESGFQVYKKD